MNNLTTFTNKEFGKLRTIETNKGIYFVGKDLALMLGYKNPRKALIDNVDERDKVVTKVTTSGGVQDTTVIVRTGCRI